MIEWLYIVIKMTIFTYCMYGCTRYIDRQSENKKSDLIDLIFDGPFVWLCLSVSSFVKKLMTTYEFIFNETYGKYNDFVNWLKGKIRNDKSGI